jgi:hypothetical protein
VKVIDFEVLILLIQPRHTKGKPKNIQNIGENAK